jgi:hypothetical protein
MSAPTPIQVGRAAEHYVVAEIHRRGGWAACFGGNMPKIDVLASDFEQVRKITIQVKAKRGGTSWQTSIRKGRPWEEAEAPADRFWVLVDLRPAAPEYFVMPEWWIENNIYDAHGDYLALHGGVRPGNPDSLHHAIPVARVEQWCDRWDVLGIVGDDLLVRNGVISSPDIRPGPTLLTRTGVVLTDLLVSLLLAYASC